MDVAQSRIRVGYDSLGMGWGGRVERKKKKMSECGDQRDFVTFAIMSVEHSVSHGPQIGESTKPNKESQEPRILGPSGDSIALHTEGTTVQNVWRQLCGRNMDQWRFAMRQKVQGDKWAYSEDCAFMVAENTAYLVGMIDDCEKNIFWEHNEEADHLAKPGDRRAEEKHN